jgi:DNA-binding response OmpR family regulator
VRIVVVDTDIEFRQRLIFQLRQKSHDVTGVPDAPALYRYLAANACDVVILDPDLPGEDGYAVTRHLRSGSGINIIMLSALDSIENRVQGLSCGTDAYLIKPVDLRELTATLESVNRRSNNQALVPPETTQENWLLLAYSWQLISPRGDCVTLTAYECQLLALLVERLGAPVSRREIVEAFGHDYRHYDERRLEAIVSRLRRKLEPFHGGTTPLQTAHGFGYAFTAPAATRSLAGPVPSRREIVTAANAERQSQAVAAMRR